VGERVKRQKGKGGFETDPKGEKETFQESQEKKTHSIKERGFGEGGTMGGAQLKSREGKRKKDLEKDGWTPQRRRFIIGKKSFRKRKNGCHEKK